MSDTPKNCAHSICTCKAKEGSKYCSQFCEDAAGTTTIACDCPCGTCGGHASGITA